MSFLWQSRQDSTSCNVGRLLMVRLVLRASGSYDRIRMTRGPSASLYVVWLSRGPIRMLAMCVYVNGHYMVDYDVLNTWSSVPPNVQLWLVSHFCVTQDAPCWVPPHIERPNAPINDPISELDHVEASLIAHAPETIIPKKARVSYSFQPPKTHIWCHRPNSCIRAILFGAIYLLNFLNFQHLFSRNFIYFIFSHFVSPLFDREALQTFCPLKQFQIFQDFQDFLLFLENNIGNYEKKLLNKNDS